MENDLTISEESIPDPRLNPFAPPNPDGWRFNAPPGWPRPPKKWVPEPGWRPSADWPAPPPGWHFWVEPFQGYKMLCSFATAVLGITAIASGQPGNVLIGLLLVLAVGAAAKFSGFWTKYHMVPHSAQRKILWVAAIPGGLFVIVLIWGTKVTCDIILSAASRADR
jgi:hypothetical protein